MKPQKLEDGTYAKFAWPGGYPIFYLDTKNLVLCPDCANKEDEYNDPIAASDINYEDDCLFCDDCSNQIESAYGED